MTVSALWLFLMVPWVGPQCSIVVFLDHIHLPFDEYMPPCNLTEALFLTGKSYKRRCGHLKVFHTCRIKFTKCLYDMMRINVILAYIYARIYDYFYFSTFYQ